MCPRTCCAAFSEFHTERRVAEFYAHLSRLQSFCDPVNGNHFHRLDALAAPNLKDRSKNHIASCAWVMVGNFAQEEKFSSPCNGLFALEGISFSTGSLRIREVSGMGSATARRTTALRLILLAGCLFPTAKLHCLLLQRF
jgi:hypothetical protein